MNKLKGSVPRRQERFYMGVISCGLGDRHSADKQQQLRHEPHDACSSLSLQKVSFALVS
jgi:hypothetical protein